MFPHRCVVHRRRSNSLWCCPVAVAFPPPSRRSVAVAFPSPTSRVLPIAFRPVAVSIPKRRPLRRSRRPRPFRHAWIRYRSVSVRVRTVTVAFRSLRATHRAVIVPFLSASEPSPSPSDPAPSRFDPIPSHFVPYPCRRRGFPHVPRHGSSRCCSVAFRVRFVAVAFRCPPSRFAPLASRFVSRPSVAVACSCLPVAFRSDAVPLRPASAQS